MHPSFNDQYEKILNLKTKQIISEIADPGNFIETSRKECHQPQVHECMHWLFWIPRAAEGSTLALTFDRG
jgi:hypothetical protein